MFFVAARSWTTLPRMAGIAASTLASERFFGEYEPSEASGVKPGAVGTVTAAGVVVVVAVSVSVLVVVIVDVDWRSKHAEMRASKGGGECSQCLSRYLSL